MRRARPNELEGLLADSGDTDTEAETMSLHSNFGAAERRRRKRRGVKTITIFGWNLFGRPPIHLPDDEEDALLTSRRTLAQNKPGALSSSTLDSDAAPLDTAAIEHMQITSAQLDERAAAVEAESKRLKEERRQLRRERRELQKMAQALTLAAAEGSTGVEEGSEGHRHTTSLLQDHPPSPPPPPTHSGISNGLGGIVAFFKGNPSDTEPDSDEADLGGHIYARRATSMHSNGSDSRSRTSASMSNPDQSTQYNHHYQSSPVPLPHSAHSDLTSNADEPPRKAKSSKSKSSKSHSSNRSLSSTSQSPSLPSPIHTSFLPSPAVVLPHSPLSLSAPLQEFEGYPADGGASSGFPSAGLGGGRSKGRDMGAFLAHRGNS